MYRDRGQERSWRQLLFCHLGNFRECAEAHSLLPSGSSQGIWGIWKALAWDVGQFRDAFNGSEISAYIDLETKAFLSFLDDVGREFAGMLSRPTSQAKAFHMPQIPCELQFLLCKCWLRLPEDKDSPRNEIDIGETFCGQVPPIDKIRMIPVI